MLSNLERPDNRISSLSNKSMNQNTVSTAKLSRRAWWGITAILSLASAIVGGVVTSRIFPSATPTSVEPRGAAPVPSKLVGHAIGSEPEKAEDEYEVVELPMDRWKFSDIQIQNVAESPFTKTIQLTGKVSLNQDRVAHIYPMIEGAVESVSVSLGQNVKANDILAIIHSREVGDAKLQLYQARLQLELAQTRDRLQSEIANNARELIHALRDGKPIHEIERAFRSKPMGDFRERALATYSNYLKSSADLSRLESVAESGAISGKQILNAEANRNADQATFQSRIEQIEYELGTSVLLSQQAVKEADAKVLVAATSLRILGCDQKDIEDINPLQQGESLSHYTIRAPFDGTVLTKDVALREQVRPDVMIVSIADLSTVWITADIYEENLPLLQSMEGRTVLVRNKALPEQTFEARVFTTGDIMDETTRTIAMRAIADNPQNLLKPGMFITVELSGSDEASRLQIPLSAVQEHEGRKFVFLHKGEEQFERRDVTLGESNDTSILVTDGLKAGEAVVVNGGFVLKSLMLSELMGEE
jgi:membrane fusion protein, heavy metal efflux system